MDKDFQDRIDEYLLHADKISNYEKVKFRQEISSELWKRNLLVFTRHVKDAITTRNEKLKAIDFFQQGQ